MLSTRLAILGPVSSPEMRSRLPVYMLQASLLVAFLVSKVYFYRVPSYARERQSTRVFASAGVPISSTTVDAILVSDTDNKGVAISKKLQQQVIIEDDPALEGSTRTSISKILVVASICSENTSWLQAYLSSWSQLIYVVNDLQAPLQVPQNKGREWSAYLSYIIDNYDNLPDISVFLHGNRYQWHNEDPMYGQLIL